MSLIEIYHVIADMFPVDPDWTDRILEGHLVTLDANGLITMATGAVNTATLGICADTLSNNGTGTPYSQWPFGTVIVGSQGSRWGTTNRVSDFFNETLASGLMTVYHGGGRFASDNYDELNYIPGQALYSTGAGHLTNVASANGQIVGRVAAEPELWVSGVPGTDVNQSISLGNYIDFVLAI